MKSYQLFVIFAVIFNAVTITAKAAPITFTGAELANLPAVSFPSGNQTIIGDSLFLEPGTAFRPIYLALPLDGFNVDRSNIGVSIEITRLADRNGGEDFNFRFGITDGTFGFTNLFFNPATPGSLRPRAEIVRIDTDFTFFPTVTSLGSGAEGAAAVGSTSKLNYTFRATPTTSFVDTSLDQGPVHTGGTSQLLQAGAPLTLIIGGGLLDVDYLINSLTFTNGVTTAVSEPEPGQLLLLSFSLLGLSLHLHRRRKREDLL